MDRWSRMSLWALTGAALTASGCADLLGFQTFSDGDGGETTSSSASRSVTSAGPGSSSGRTSTATGVSTGTATGTSTGTGTSMSTGTAPSSSTSIGVGPGGSSGASSGPGGSSTASSSASPMMASSSSSAASSSSASSISNPATPGPCTWGTAYNGGGSFTWYYFGQGTYQQNGMYKTACGYYGSESGSGQGATDTVSNAANVSPAKDTYFAAIPGTSSSNFNTVGDCGACVEITNGGNKIVATIIDECPMDTNSACGNGHLDLSTQAFDALGYSTGDPSGTSWKFVPCPVGTTNIQAVANGSGQIYLQDSVYPITTVNGQPATNYGYFNVSPGPATVTANLGSQTLTITINIPGSGNGDTGANFTPGSNCY